MPEHGTTEQGTPAEEQKSGTSWNSGGTTEHPGTQAEHPRIPTENQLNASKTPLNNGTIQNKERLQCFFQKFSTSLSFIEHCQLKVEISYSADINSCFIH